MQDAELQESASGSNRYVFLDDIQKGVMGVFSCFLSGSSLSYG